MRKELSSMSEIKTATECLFLDHFVSLNIYDQFVFLYTDRAISSR